VLFFFRLFLSIFRQKNWKSLEEFFSSVNYLEKLAKFSGITKLKKKMGKKKPWCSALVCPCRQLSPIHPQFECSHKVRVTVKLGSVKWNWACRSLFQKTLVQNMSTSKANLNIMRDQPIYVRKSVWSPLDFCVLFSSWVFEKTRA
jgi:hypothetical protein